MTGRTTVTRAEAERDVERVTHFLALGHPVKGKPGNRRGASATRLAGDSLGIDRATFRERIGTPAVPGSHFRNFSLAPDWSIAARRGELGTAPVLAGFSIKEATRRLGKGGQLVGETIKQARAPGPRFTVPEGMDLRSISALTDGAGNLLLKWDKIDKAKPDPMVIVEAIKAAFLDYPGRALATPAPAALAEDKLALLPCADFHIGMYAWAPEAGSNWDLKLAEDVIGRAIEEAVERTEPCGRAIVLGGGDLLHADNQENRTARSGNALQVDGRYQKVLMAASRLMVRAVEANLRRHGHVTVRILPGNHDEHASVAVAYFLLAWFRDEPRVTVDVDPSLFFWFRFGDVLLGATHGHSAKIQDMPSIMAHRRAVDWGLTRHRFVHGFHLHHAAKFQTEGQGVISEIHQSPVPQDAWHFGSGFLSGRSIQTITYHRRFGEISRARVVIMDAGQDIAA